MAPDGKLSREQLAAFVNECEHYPTEGELNDAFNSVFKGMYFCWILKCVLLFNIVRALLFICAFYLILFFYFFISLFFYFIYFLLFL